MIKGRERNNHGCAEQEVKQQKAMFSGSGFILGNKKEEEKIAGGEEY